MSRAIGRLPEADKQELLKDIDAGFALPSNWYADPDVFAGEVDKILRRSWHYATDVGQLAKVGDQYLCNIAGVPVVLVRDRNDEIAGFVNICRHRAHPVVIEASNRKTLQCQYHGWSYNLDGGLRGAPRSETDPTFDPTQFGLTPVQTHMWGPMVWVNVDRTAPPFTQWISGLPELMASRDFDVASCVHGWHADWQINANWKVFTDNTIECYHCPTCHPELARVLEMDVHLQELSIGGRYWIAHKIPFREGINLGPTLQPPPGEPFNYYYHWIFPTTYLQHYANRFDIGTLDVRAVDRMRFRHITFVPPDTEPAVIDDGQRRLDVDPTILQDVDICERVQTSHASGMGMPGRLLPGSEFLLQHFQRLIVEMMAEP